MKRWVCPECGKGVNAPSRLRKNDTRRYCLECSAHSTRLVERTCPVLEKKRKAKAQVRKKKAAAFRARKLAHDNAPFPTTKVSIVKEFHRCRKLDPKLRNARLDTLRRYKHKDSTGTTYPGLGLVTLTVGHGIPEAYSIILHELAHVGARPGEGHGDLWRSMYIELVRKRFPGIEFDFGLLGKKKYGLDPVVIAGIGKWLESNQT